METFSLPNRITADAWSDTTMLNIYSNAGAIIIKIFFVRTIV